MKGAWAHGAQERIVGQRLQHKQNQRLIATAIFSIVPRKCTFVEQRRTCCPQDVPPVVGNRHRFRRRDYCGGCESGPLEKGAREYFWPDWPDETLNLFSGQHSLRCLRKGKRYCFVFFGHSRLAVKLNIWSEGLVKLAPPPSQAWVGSWRSGHHRLQRGLDVASARIYIVLAIGEGQLPAVVTPLIQSILCLATTTVLNDSVN
jgi:hypothetical protein